MNAGPYPPLQDNNHQPGPFQPSPYSNPQYPKLVNERENLFAQTDKGVWKWLMLVCIVRIVIE